MNAEVVSGFYDAVNAKDAVAISELIATHFAADVKLIWPPSLPYGGTVTGAAKLGRLFAGMLAAPSPVGPTEVTVLALIDGGAQVAAQLSFDWFAPGSSASLASGALELWSFADGLVTEIRAYYWDTAELLSAAPPDPFTRQRETQMRSAVIVDAVRTPMAKGKAAKGDKPGGALSTVHPVELLGQTLRQLVERTGIDPADVDDVITGCVSQAAEQAGPVGRWAWLAAGLPESVPSVAINRACGSSQQAADFGAQGVIAGAYDMVVACGVESMSRVPMMTARMGTDPFGPSVAARYEPGLVSQGVSAELIAARWGFDRHYIDEYSAASHSRAAAVDFSSEIVGITLPDGTVVSLDETIRPGTTAESLGALKSAFYTEEMAARFPEIKWHITPGNSSQLTDGASAVLIMSEERAEELELRPRARFHSFALAGDDPITMLTGPIPATEKVLRRAGLSIEDIDHYEVNEAFATVPLAWLDHFKADPDKLNPRGGAIALGHPLGASGTRLLTTMLNALEATGGRFGLQTMCEAGGMANATIIERI